MKSKEILNILARKHDHDRVSKWFQNSKILQTKYENYKIHQGFTISYVEDVVKICTSFEHFVMYGAYKSKHLRRSFRELRSRWLDLNEKQQSNLNSIFFFK
jgi:hypothetical protein